MRREGRDEMSRRVAVGVSEPLKVQVGVFRGVLMIKAGIGYRFCHFEGERGENFMVSARRPRGRVLKDFAILKDNFWLCKRFGSFFS